MYCSTNKEINMTIEEALEKYYKQVYTILYCTLNSNRQIAEDITNDIFCIMISKWNRINKDCIYSWLLKTTDHKLKEYYRYKKKERCMFSIEDLYTEPFDNRDMVDLITSDEIIEKKKKQILLMLSEDERNLYEDYFVNNLSYDEISQKLNIKYNAVSARVVKLRRKIEAEVYKNFAVCGNLVILRLLIALIRRD